MAFNNFMCHLYPYPKALSRVLLNVRNIVTHSLTLCLCLRVCAKWFYCHDIVLSSIVSCVQSKWYHVAVCVSVAVGPTVSIVCVGGKKVDLLSKVYNVSVRFIPLPIFIASSAYYVYHSIRDIGAHKHAYINCNMYNGGQRSRFAAFVCDVS